VNELKERFRDSLEEKCQVGAANVGIILVLFTIKPHC
jgi:hypothetical protein